MTPSPDLLAVLREAREALRSCAWSTELRTDDALMAMATADAKIGEATMMLTVSALSAREPQGWPKVCDGKEQDAFEAWAASEMYDMTQHPLHWLFLDPRTYAARQGWKAAIEYGNRKPLPEPPK